MTRAAQLAHIPQPTCIICGGLMIKQNVLNGCHRNKDDCIAHLRLAVKQLEPRAAFGDQCYQDRCENAYVEQSVMDRAVRSAKSDALDKEGLFDELVATLHLVIASANPNAVQHPTMFEAWSKAEEWLTKARLQK